MSDISEVKVLTPPPIGPEPPYEGGYATKEHFVWYARRAHAASLLAGIAGGDLPPLPPHVAVIAGKNLWPDYVPAAWAETIPGFRELIQKERATARANARAAHQKTVDAALERGRIEAERSREMQEHFRSIERDADAKKTDAQRAADAQFHRGVDLSVEQGKVESARRLEEATRQQA